MVAEEESGATEEAVGLEAAGAVAEEDSAATEEAAGAAESSALSCSPMGCFTATHRVGSYAIMPHAAAHAPAR